MSVFNQFVLKSLTSENIFLLMQKGCGKSSNLVTKSGSISKFGLSKPPLMLLRENQKSGIYLLDEDTSLGCRMASIHRPNNAADLHSHDGLNVGPHLLLY